MRYTTLMLTALMLGAVAAGAAAQPAAPAAAPAATAADDPTAVVQTAAQGILGELDKNREIYRRDPAKLSDLVNRYLLPHFDEELAARLVLGQYWRSATPEQREHFVKAFYHSLLANYGDALVDFTADRLKIYPTKLEPGASRATVRTEVKRANGDRVSVNYYLHKSADGWKAWDVVIDGISYVNSYREDFGAAARAAGNRLGDQAPGVGRKAERHRQAAQRQELMSATRSAPPRDAAADAAAAFRLEAGAGGGLTAHGPLTFATARQARLIGLRALAGGGQARLEIDCDAVTTADSAGLAVLLDWLAVAKGQGRSLRLLHLPEGLGALARISEVEELLTRGV